MAARRYQYYAMDLIYLPKTKTEWVTLLVGIDCKCRFGHVVLLRNKTSSLVIGALESYILSTTLTTPEEILTDGGPEFKGNESIAASTRFGIRHDSLLPYLPQSNERVERFNQTFKKIDVGECGM